MCTQHSLVIYYTIATVYKYLYGINIKGTNIEIKIVPKRLKILAVTFFTYRPRSVPKW